MSNNWNGVGCPEVGEWVLIVGPESLLNHRTRDFSGEKVLVMSTFNDNGKLCLAISHPARGIGAIIFNDDWVKPIKSDRDKAVDEMMKLFKDREHDFAFKEDMGLLYDAGFKKQSGE